MDKHLEVSRPPNPPKRMDESAEAEPSPPAPAPTQKLAGKHFDTLFLRANVANVPFLVTKLEIKVLPCVVGFVDGLSKLK